MSLRRNREMQQESVWLQAWENLLRKQSSPVLEFYKEEASIQELLSAANIWTRALERKRELYRLGLRTGDILVDVSSNRELIVNMVACAMGGWIYWPVKKTETDKFKASVNNFARKTFLFSSQSVLQVEREELDLSFLRSEDVLLLSTSGTTGASRIVSFTGDSLLQQIQNINSGLGCEEESGRLIVLPFHHCFGFILDLLAGLFKRQSLHICNQSIFNPENILKIVSQNEIHHLSLVPRMVDLLATYLEKNPLRASAVKGIQIHCGGAVVSETLRQKIEPWVLELVEGYGLTEMAGGVLLRGVPNGCEVKLHPSRADSTLFELWIKGPTMGHFSLRDQFLDKDGYLNSGDLVRMNSDGEIRVIGRVGSYVKSSDGTWVDFAKIEKQLIKRFSFQRIYVDGVQGELRIVVAGSKTNEKAIREFVERYYGISLRLIEVPNDEGFDRILLSSTRKSATEAISDWEQGQKCA